MADVGFDPSDHVKVSEYFPNRFDVSSHEPPRRWGNSAVLLPQLRVAARGRLCFVAGRQELPDNAEVFIRLFEVRQVGAFIEDGHL